MHSTDLRWRAVSLIYIYSLPIADVCDIFGVSMKPARPWYALFDRTGSVENTEDTAPMANRSLRRHQDVFA